MSDMGSKELATKGDLEQMRRSLAKEILKCGAKIDRLEETMRGEMKAWGSNLVKTFDGFASQVGKVDRAQVIADWRMTQLEKRVGTLEAR